jgi:hypothetical protein
MNCEICNKKILTWKAKDDWSGRKRHMICHFKRQKELQYEIFLEDLISTKEYEQRTTKDLLSVPPSYNG